MNPSALSWLNVPADERRAVIGNVLQGKSRRDFIELVDAGGMGVRASLGAHFDYAVFGRDSIRVAKDLIETHAELARTIILTLASLQGTAFDTTSEEEPGKIHHEHRRLIFNGQRIPEANEQILRHLQRQWGGDGTDEMTYYGSCDATPMYVRLAHNYVSHYGTALLSMPYADRTGKRRTIADSVRAAVQWVAGRVESSEWGLLEYKRQNPHGIPNQVWKDSNSAYLHADGALANFDGGIAAIELQGYAYDALMDAAQLFPDDRDVDRWRELAHGVRERTLEYFWMPTEQYFAQGLDRDASGARRHIETLTSNPALLLRSRILREMDDTKRRDVVGVIVDKIMSPEFLTEAGIRCRALRHKAIPGFPDYHGTFTSWPKDTYEIAKGLHLHGYTDASNVLDSRVLAAVHRSGEFFEFYYVDDDGSYLADQQEARARLAQRFDQSVEMPVPEAGQAWTISAVLAILHHHQLAASKLPIA